jgi:SagB-type dehydrogenase family enzyme
MFFVPRKVKPMSKFFGNEFLRKSCYPAMGPSPHSEGQPQPPLQLEYDREAPTFELPDPQKAEVAPVTVREAVEIRRSLRRYTETPLSVPELSYLLWCTQGVKKATANATLRTVPSAGARHCFETFLLINRVDGLEPGLYRYLALEHRLLPVNRDHRIRSTIVESCLGQEFVGECAAMFIWTAAASRMTWRYGERGYRYMFLDAGHVCQNLYLAAETVECGACAVGAFDDDLLNRALGLDGEEQFVVYAAALGKRR